MGKGAKKKKKRTDEDGRFVAYYKEPLTWGVTLRTDF